MTSTKTCDACQRRIGEREVSFVLRFELFADPTPPDISEEDLARDHRAEMEALIKSMKDIDPGEAGDEVHERYEYTLCKTCRRDLHHQLKFPFLARG